MSYNLNEMNDNSKLWSILMTTIGLVAISIVIIFEMIK
jgi:hypothetical protein